MPLAHVAAIIEISALKSRFFEAVDRCPGEPAWAAAELRTMFVGGIQGDYGEFGKFDGSDAYIDFLITAYAQFDWLWHCAHSPRIEIDGRRAVGRWTSDAHARIKASGSLIASINRYRDDFVLTGDGWRFAVVRDILEARNDGSGWSFADNAG